MRLDPSPSIEKFHLAIVGEISPGETSLDNLGISDRQIWKPGTQPVNFYHCNLTNMFVMLNSRRYPEIDYVDTNFTQQKFSRVYGDAAAFRTKFYNVEELISSANITPADYNELFPMFVFDISKQREKLKNSVTDIQIKAQVTANVAANTEAFPVVIIDKSLIFQSDGQKMRVEY